MTIAQSTVELDRLDVLLADAWVDPEVSASCPDYGSAPRSGSPSG